MNKIILKIFALFILPISLKTMCMDSDKSNSEINQKLIEAIKKGSLEEVQNALKEGADINFTDNTENRETPMHYALATSNLEIVKLLVWLGVDIDKPCSYTYEMRMVNYGRGNFFVNHYTPITPTTYTYLRTRFDTKMRTIDTFLTNLSPKLKNVENKSLKSMVKEVNKFLRNRITEQDYLLKDLQNIVIEYSLYPENYKEFFNLPDSRIDELIKIYSEAFEKDDLSMSLSDYNKSKRRKLDNNDHQNL